MKFIDVKFRGKNKFLNNAVKEIMIILEHNLTLDVFSELAIRRYLEILLEDQDFNPKTNVFYDNLSKRKLNYNFLASIAKEYILEHEDEFLKISQGLEDEV